MKISNLHINKGYCKGRERDFCLREMIQTKINPEQIWSDATTLFPIFVIPKRKK